MRPEAQWVQTLAVHDKPFVSTRERRLPVGELMSKLHGEGTHGTWNTTTTAWGCASERILLHDMALLADEPPVSE